VVRRPAEPVGPGATIELERAYAARLAPTAEAGFRAPPERAPKPDRFGAALEVAKVDTPGSTRSRCRTRRGSMSSRTAQR